METLVRVVDETPSGDRTEAVTLRMIGSLLTVRDLITRRVEAEVALQNAARRSDWTGALVAPWRPAGSIRTRQRVDPEHQVLVALEAFKRNVFFVFVGERQLSSLDDPLDLGADDTVSFLRMMPMLSG